MMSANLNALKEVQGIKRSDARLWIALVYFKTESKLIIVNVSERYFNSNEAQPPKWTCEWK